jgi:hypothetical protein
MNIIATENAIGRLEEAYEETPPMVLTGKDLERRQAVCKEYDKATSRNKEHRKQVFALILGQVTPILLGQLENKAAYPAIYTRKDPLKLYDLIGKAGVQQNTEDSYVYAMAISELQQFLALRQQHATPEAYYDTFNGRTDVSSKNIGMWLGHHQILLDYVAKDLYQKEYAKCDAKEKPLVEADNLERLLAFTFIHFACASCTILCDELKRDFTKGTNQYLKTMAQALKYVQNCATTTPVSSTSEGVAFAQKGGTGKGPKTSNHNKSTLHRPTCRSGPPNKSATSATPLVMLHFTAHSNMHLRTIRWQSELLTKLPIPPNPQRKRKLLLMPMTRVSKHNFWRSSLPLIQYRPGSKMMERHYSKITPSLPLIILRE